MLQNETSFMVIIAIMLAVIVVNLFKRSKPYHLKDFKRDRTNEVKYVIFNNGKINLENKYNLKELEIKGSETVPGYLSFCGFKK